MREKWSRIAITLQATFLNKKPREKLAKKNFDARQNISPKNSDPDLTEVAVEGCAHDDGGGDDHKPHQHQHVNQVVLKGVPPGSRIE